VAGIGAGAVGLDGFSVVVVDETGRQLSWVDTTLPFTGAFDVQLAVSARRRQRRSKDRAGVAFADAEVFE
jgi:predicted amino acid dehydrogenase